MKLTWKDAIATVFVAVIVVIYAAFLRSTTAWLISSARGCAALAPENRSTQGEENGQADRER
jgi:hypothetical protein